MSIESILMRENLLDEVTEQCKLSLSLIVLRSLEEQFNPDKKLELKMFLLGLSNSSTQSTLASLVKSVLISLGDGSCLRVGRFWQWLPII